MVQHIIVTADETTARHLEALAVEFMSSDLIEANADLDDADACADALLAARHPRGAVSRLVNRAIEEARDRRHLPDER